MCAFSYLAVYVARNILSAVSPQMIESGGFSNENIGTLSSIFFISYATGQLINGFVGDKIIAKWMVGIGLFFSGVCNLLFSIFAHSVIAAYVSYAATGFLDFVSYMAAAASSTLFANAVSDIGWGNLILVWAGLMALGVIVALPYKRKNCENESEQ